MALLEILATAFVGHVRGTGYYGPDEYLSRWTNLDETPEFYWEQEVKRMARDFHPKEKLMLARLNPELTGSAETSDDPQAAATSAAKDADLAAAIKDGEIKSADDDHTEFTDYEDGAEFYRTGKDQWYAARKAWLALLDRPAAQRHYRTVWAAFMLGKLAMNSGDPEAAGWFEKTREYAAQGFADSLGLAADSYGWEGRADLRQGHPEKAAPMYLTQLALGDISAVVSLKALIPDREKVEGNLNYEDNGLVDGSEWTEPTPGQKKAEEPKLIEKLKVMAADPLLRRLETAHILATQADDIDEVDQVNGTQPPSRSERWMKVLASVKPEKVEDAEYLGWVAYTTGNYKEAQRWLDMSTGDSPVASWLRARLELRAGRMADAAASMARAWQGIRDRGVYTGWTGTTDEQDSVYLVSAEDGGLTMQEWVNGDMGTVRLMTGDFVQAMDIFLKGGLWEDAAYVAERVLTTAELKKYVDQMPPAEDEPLDAQEAEGAGGEDYYSPDNVPEATPRMRYLLGRRLVREDRYAEAAAYFPPAYAKLLGKYAGALRNGADASLSKQVRADNWSTAAWLARHDGMELMGTDVAPDGFDSGGSFPNPDVAKARLTGAAQDEYDEEDVNPPVTRLPFPARKQEAARLRANPIRPDIRYHYRIIAAALAMRAAALMEDNTEELADAVNHAGLWVKDRDEKLGDAYYNVIEKRCAQTKIGQDVLAKHWFVDEPGPWSTPLQAQADSLHKAFGIQAPE